MSPPEDPDNAPELVLCPGCCTAEDISARPCDPQAAIPLAGCRRCSFTFPILPAEYAELTVEAMHRHHCSVSRDPENYEGVAQVIIGRVQALGLNQATFLERARAAAVIADASETPEDGPDTKNYPKP